MERCRTRLHHFIALAEAMPEDKWNFTPTHGEFKRVRTFGEHIKHVACGNEAWAKQMAGEKTPERCDLGGPNPAKTRAEILCLGIGPKSDPNLEENCTVFWP